MALDVLSVCGPLSLGTGAERVALAKVSLLVKHGYPRLPCCDSYTSIPAHDGFDSRVTRADPLLISKRHNADEMAELLWLLEIRL